MEKSVFTPEYQTFLKYLRKVRLESGITQVQLAKMLGEPQSFVSNCERGEHRLDIIELHAFCKALGKPLPEFIAGLYELLSES